ncbi:MAG: exodeoxyribonuclease VII small subunit [Clostridia bacterium]|nr:exodeoxyribonuclease VII small subunit [Clostridia bacterium]
MMSMENITFEQAIARLEAVVRALEDGKTSLEEAMKLYEEGVALVRSCSTTLEEAKQKIITVSVGGNADNA